MSSSKEIRSKIKSIESTKKITKAMEMIAASKVRKAQDRMKQFRPYAQKMTELVAHVAGSLDEGSINPYLVQKSPVKTVGFIVVTTNKGLCGGLNNNLLRLIMEQIEMYTAQGIEVQVSVFGQKGLNFFKRAGIKVLSFASLSDLPTVEDITGCVQVMLNAFLADEIQDVKICYNKFVNIMKQSAVIEHFVPISVERLNVQETNKENKAYIYEPSIEQVVNQLIKRYLQTVSYQALVENIASEHSARMVAMKAATDNASNFIDELRLKYNKTRQAAITKEISEIIGGAAAL